MMVNCPECGKKHISRTEPAVNSHVFKSKVHADLTMKDKNALYRSMISYRSESGFSKGRDRYENQLCKTTGLI